MKSSALKYLLASGLMLAASPAAAQYGLSDHPPIRHLHDATDLIGGLVIVPHEAPAEAATETASPAAGGKYRHLLRKIEVPADRDSYGEYYDWGHWSGTSWAGHNDLPPGYWVYVDGWWYIFGESGQHAPPTFTSTDDTLPAPAAPAEPAPAATAPTDAVWSAKGRAWGPEQATGAPDTPQAGDIQSAWASASQDDQAEWLELTYEAPIDAVAAMIHETYNPGAVTKITVFDAEGNEHTVYEAAAHALAPRTELGVLILGGPETKEPLVLSGGKADAYAPQRRTLVVPIVAGFATQRVKVYLDSAAVPGWNEIDAVGLIDSAGNTHWASGATASSAYADRIEQNVGRSTGTIDLIWIGTPEERIRQLEEEVRRLQTEIEQLRGQAGLPFDYLLLQPSIAR